MRKLQANEKIIGEVVINGVECYIISAEMDDAPVVSEYNVAKSEIDLNSVSNVDMTNNFSLTQGSSCKNNSNKIEMDDAPVVMTINDLEK